jgi:hypothetical protein
MGSRTDRLPGRTACRRQIFAQRHTTGHNIGEIRQPHDHAQNQIFAAYRMPFAEQAIARPAAKALDQV